jgi:hypothetical protein
MRIRTFLSRAFAATVVVTGGGPTLAADAPPIAQPEDATRVHALLIADTMDKDIGESVAVDLRQMKAAIENGLPESRRSIAQMTGADVTPAAILARVRSLPVAATDGLVVYYAGHGAWADTGPYLRLHDAALLQRADLVAAMRERAPRLAVLLTDCCSTYVGKAAFYRAAVADPDVFRDLFFRHRGLVDITAAQKGQVAVGDTMQGGIFTQALTEVLTATPRETLDADRDGVVSWAEAAADLATRTKGVFEMLHPRGVTVKGTNIVGQTPQVFGEIAKPAAGPLSKSPQRLGVKLAETGGRGVRVDEVTPGTPAAWVGLRVGDVLTEMRVGSGMTERMLTLKTVADLRAAFAANPGSQLVVFVLGPPATGPAPPLPREISIRLAPAP